MSFVAVSGSGRAVSRPPLEMLDALGWGPFSDAQHAAQRFSRQSSPASELAPDSAFVGPLRATPCNEVTMDASTRIA